MADSSKFNQPSYVSDIKTEMNGELRPVKSAPHHSRLAKNKENSSEVTNNTKHRRPKSHHVEREPKSGVHYDQQSSLHLDWRNMDEDNESSSESSSCDGDEEVSFPKVDILSMPNIPFHKFFNRDKRVLFMDSDSDDDG